MYDISNILFAFKQHLGVQCVTLENKGMESNHVGAFPHTPLGWGEYF